jgi:hypothetical protein
MNRDLTTRISTDMASYTNGDIIDTAGAEGMEIATVAKNTTKFFLKHGDVATLSDGEAVLADNYIVGDDTGTMTNGTTTAGTAGTVTDTTSYPVATQAAKTEKITVDSGTEQTVTFTTAIDVGTVIDTTSYPVTDQATKTLGITFDGGDEQTVTFGTATTAAHIIEDINAQITGGYAEADGAQVRLFSNTVGATSAVAVNVTACDLTFDTPGKVNFPAGIASQINAQTYGVLASVVSDQVVLTSNTFGTASTVAIGTGTCDLTWDTAAAGTGDTGPYVFYDAADTARIGYNGKKRYVQFNIVNPATDTTVAVIKGDLRVSPAS